MTAELAQQNLQLIRTLMERSTLYRRALAPMMLLAGLAALAAAATGHLCQISAPRAFLGLWGGTSAAVLVAAGLLTRRAAVQEREPFWSPPARRVAQAFGPALLAGAALSAVWWIEQTMPHIATWALLYGCALHAAGMFAPRTLRRAGCLFIGAGLGLLALPSAPSPHLAMGAIFGGLHLVAAVYLMLTEPKA